MTRSGRKRHRTDLSVLVWP